MGNQLKLAALKAVTFGGWLLEGFNEKTLPVLKKYYLVNCSEGEEIGGSIYKALESTSLEKLQQQWTTAFCIGPCCIPPEESVVRTGLSMQEPRDKTLNWYLKFGEKPSSRVPADHLGIQLFFLSRLLLEADSTKDEEEKRQLLEEAQTFAKEHLDWVEDLVKKVRLCPNPENLSELILLLDQLPREIKDIKEEISRV